MIYHYTKGFTLNSIFVDGYIATEGRRGICQVAKLTNYVWLTEKRNYPKTALPHISGMPETSLLLHTFHNNIYVDMNALGGIIGGIWRFGFSKEDSRFTKWWHSAERRLIADNVQWRSMESLANKVGDEVRAFWISNDNVILENFTLQRLVDDNWIDVLKNCTLSNLSADEKTTIEGICTASLNTCSDLGINEHQTRLAA